MEGCKLCKSVAAVVAKFDIEVADTIQIHIIKNLSDNLRVVFLEYFL